MKFKKMELDTDIQVAELDYLYNRERTEFMISASYGEVSLGADNEDEITDHYYITRKYVQIEVTEYKTPETGRRTGIRQNLNIIIYIIV